MTDYDLTNKPLTENELSALGVVNRSRLNGVTATQIGEAVEGWLSGSVCSHAHAARQVGQRIAAKLIARGLIYSVGKSGKTRYYSVVDTNNLTLG